MVVPRELSSIGVVISKKNLNTYMHIHTHIKELLALNTVHVPVFLHTRTHQLRVAPEAVCVHLFANQIKTIKYYKFKNEKNASKYHRGLSSFIIYVIPPHSFLL